MPVRPRRPIIVVSPGGVHGQGGIGRHVRYTRQAWQRLALDPPLVVLDSYGSRSMPLSFAVCAFRLLGRLITGRAGLVHLHMAADGSVVRKLLLARLAACFGVPVVVHVHGSRFAEFLSEIGPFARAALAREMRRASRVVTLGAGWRETLSRSLSLDPATVSVMPNAVPIGAAAPRTAGEGCRIVFLGRVGSRKGVPELLDALAALDEPGLAWSATIAGDGEVEEFRNRAVALSLGERVAFTGWLPEDRARDLLASADLLVLPSRNEGQPMAIIEAMAAGLPVVASTVGAIPEMVRDGKNGLLVPPGDVGALQRALHRLVTDAAERSRLGTAARVTVETEHDIDAHCRRLHALYRSLAPRRGTEAALAAAATP